MIWSKEDLSLALNQDIEFSTGPVRFNSNQVEPGDLFIALKGQKDGHIYLGHALEKKSGIAIIDHIPSGIQKNDRMVVVKDTYQALMALAQFRRKQSKAKFISITGSCGKTSTKFYLSQVLSKFTKTSYSPASFNNYLGILITLASVPLDCEYVIVEVGTNNYGEISSLAQMIKAHVVVILNVLNAHIGNFESFYDLVYEKAQIFKYILPNAVGIVNKMLEHNALEIIKKEAALNGISELLYFGESQSNAAILDYTLLKQDLAEVKIQLGDMVLYYKTSVTGQHNARNFLAIILVCMSLELDLEKVLLGLKDLKLMDGRGKISSIKKFNKSFKIIDDAYNSNTGSVEEDLENLFQMQHSQKVIVLSNMLELGQHSIFFHKHLKAFVEKSGAYKFIAVGDMMKNLYDIIDSNIEKHYFPDSYLLQADLYKLINNGDIIIFKGSRETNLYKVVEYLKN